MNTKRDEKLKQLFKLVTDYFTVAWGLMLFFAGTFLHSLSEENSDVRLLGAAFGCGVATFLIALIRWQMTRLFPELKEDDKE